MSQQPLHRLPECRVVGVGCLQLGPRRIQQVTHAHLPFHGHFRRRGRFRVGKELKRSARPGGITVGGLQGSLRGKLGIHRAITLALKAPDEDGHEQHRQCCQANPYPVPRDEFPQGIAARQLCRADRATFEEIWTPSTLELRRDSAEKAQEFSEKARTMVEMGQSNKPT